MNIFKKLKRRKRKSTKCKTEKKGVLANIFDLKKLSKSFSYFILISFFLSSVVYSSIIGFRFSQMELKTFNENESQTNWDGESRFNFVIIGADTKQTGYVFVDYITLVEISPRSNTVKLINLNPLFSPYFLSKDNNYTLKNKFAVDEVNFVEPQMSELLFDIQRILALKINGYVYLDEEGFQKVFGSLGNIPVNAPSELNDPDIDPGLEIKTSNNIGFDRYIDFISADDNGADDRAARQLSALQSLIDNTSLVRLVLNSSTIITEIEGNVYTNISKRDWLRILYNLRFNRETNYDIAYTKSRADYVVNTSLGEVWRPVYETIDFDLRQINVNKDAKIEQATIDVLNSTDQTGLANVRARWLKNRGLRVVSVGNSQDDVPVTQIYVQNLEDYPNTIREIQETLFGNVEIIPQEYAEKSVGEIVIILGDNEVIKYD